MYVPGMRAARVIEFMLHPADDRYRAWWPGTHLAMHTLNDTFGVANMAHDQGWILRASRPHSRSPLQSVLLGSLCEDDA